MIRGILRFAKHTLKRSVSRLFFLGALMAPVSHNQRIGSLRQFLFRMSGLNLRKPVFIDRGFRCIQPKNITIGEFVSLGHDNHIWAFSPVSIGHHTITAKDLLVVSASHDISNFEPLDNQSVEIGPGCWIGARVTIIGGVNIGAGCVIGAGSLVRSSIPDFCVAAGVPAKVLRKRAPSEKIWNQFGYYSIDEINGQGTTDES